MPESDELILAAHQLGVVLDRVQAARLLQYVALLEKWNRVHNLTAVRQTEKVLTHHVLDSLSVAPLLDCRNLLDVGSGGGLPGIPLAIAYPAMQVTLLDSNRKKAAFLRQAVIELGMDNVEVVAERVEALDRKHAFSGIISRAFSELAPLVAVTRGLLAPGGRWWLMKGVYPAAELAQLPPDIVLQAVHALQVPDLAAERHVLILRRLND